MMKKTALPILFAMLLVLCAALLASYAPAQAQQLPKIPRIGFIASASQEAVPNVEPFRAGLRELGYAEGKNILVEYRYAEGKLERLPGLVTDLVQLNVEALVLATQTAIRAV